MKTPNLALITVVPFLLLAACGGKDQPAAGGATTVAQIGAAAPADLSTLYPQELLRAKFDRATVVCTLEAPYEISVNGVVQAGVGSAQYSVDLLESSILPREGMLQTRGPVNDVVARVRLDRFRIVRTLVQDTDDGHRYVSEFAPVLEAAVEYRQSPSRGPHAAYGSANADSSRVVVSEIPQARPALSAQADTAGSDGAVKVKTGVRLGCRLDSVIKPAYAKQFEKVR